MILRILKYLALGLLTLVVLVAATVAAIWWRGPAHRAVKKDVTFPKTPEQLARGKYLAEDVAACVLCHSDRSQNLWSRPVVPASMWAGACIPDEPGAPGHVCAPNLTPDPVAGLGKWSDDEIARAIREQVDRQGRPVFAFHSDFAAMSDQDVQAVVAYLRTLSPNQKVVPHSDIPFPIRFLVAFTGTSKPQPITSAVPTPDPKNTVEYGRYLTEIGGCKTCHTPRDEDSGQPAVGQDFSGGQVFHNVVSSANLTPDPTGLGNRSKEAFIGMFRAYASPEAASIQVADDRNTSMPWVMFSKLSDQDLGAIYDYLRTVKPVHREVEKFVKSAH